MGKIESQQFSQIGEKFKEQLITPQGGFILACILGMILLDRFSGGKKKQGKLATGYFGSQKEMARAKKKAIEQIADPKCDRVALYIGRVNPLTKTKGQKASHFAIPPSPKNPGRGIFYVPDVQRGTLVLGAPGSGKTVSAINPMLFSAVDRGLPIILYDFKYPSQSKVAVFAKRHGYDVRIFAPGFPESEVCNPIDFLRDANDGENARQIGTVINKNFKQISQGQEDAFFGPAGDQLVEAILMLTKSTPYPDIMMAAQILSSEKMVQRLMAADMNPWIRQSFGQLFSSASSEKTVAGIAGSASIMFTRFMKRNTLGCFVGQTTLPLDLKGKQLAIFGMDRERRAVCGPLLCSVMHMLIARNIAKRRQDPLVVCLDEFPTLYLPDIGKWLNESRSEGFCGILGAQGLSQIEQNYGKENAKTITTGTNTKILFNLGEYETARSFSDFLGDEEVRFQQKSQSQTQGKTTKSVSDQERTRRLMEASQFNKLPPGACVFISPAYGNKDESYVPIKKQFKLSKDQQEIEADNERNWPKLVSWLSARSPQIIPSDEDMQGRKAAVDRLFPIPSSDEDSKASPIGTYSDLFDRKTS
ncbi:MAG: type IV secretion system DNA-binding domain-containing protein [Cyanobacteriota bacterium]|nr:type IV secretion system DNA-binding domain-containing protein [Cyanobacteriota bacterium]